MRVNIVGMSESAKALRGHLRALSDVAVVGLMADYTVAIVPSTEPHVTVDGSASALETGIVNQLADILGSVLVRREEGRKLPADTVVVGIPAGKEAEAERALFRAIAGKVERPKWRPWRFVALMLLLPATLQAQTVTPIKCHNGTTAFFCGDSVNSALRVNVVASVGGGGAVTQGAGFGAATGYWNTRLTDGTSFYVALTDTQLRATPVPVSGTVTATPTGTQDVNCISGCVAGGSFADAAAFTFGTTAVGLSAFVVDDVAVNAVAENSAGAARMSANRVLYVDLKQTQANTTALKVDGSAVTQPVSGTFWQATQPVSGTVTVTDGAGALNVIVDSSAAIAVTGPLTDVQLRATPVPVSGTVAATQSGTWTVQPGNTANTTAWLVTGTGGTFPVTNAGLTNLDVALSTRLKPADTLTGVTTVSTVTSVTQNADVRQATAANLNVRADTSGATGSAVPARAEYIGVSDGTNVVGQKAASAANNSTTIVTGMQLSTPIATWCVNHLPAAAAKATISRAAGAAGVRHILTTFGACFAAGATPGPVQTFTVRDGATGAGTVVATGALAAPANDSTCTTGTLNYPGTAATAATIEFGAAGAATTIETVWLCGYDVQ